MREFKKEQLSLRGTRQLLSLLHRAHKQARWLASDSDIEARELAQDIDCWLEEWTKDDHPHAVCAGTHGRGA